MRIAVTYEDGQVFQHFGQTENFKIYNVEEKKVINSSIIKVEGNGHGELAKLLTKEGVDTLLCGGIGEGAKGALAEAEITLYGGVSGDADKAVEDLLMDRLEFNPDVKCGHHGEHGGHSHDHGAHVHH